MTHRPPALTRRPSPLLALWQAALLGVLPHGGQRAARRNAWAGMSAESARSRAQREADAAIADAVRRVEGRTRAVL